MADRAAAGKAYEDNDIVVATQLGKPVDPDNFSRRFRRLRKVSSLRRITLHDTRHSHASSLLRAGVEMIVVSRRLGHEDEAFTMRIYGHVTASQQEDAVAKLDDYMSRKRAASGLPKSNVSGMSANG